jgi:methylated-DNA-[protein]-cysteine S-methyltransferase
MARTLSTPVGTLVLEANERGLSACSKRRERDVVRDDSRAAERHLEEATAMLVEYFRVERRGFDGLPIATTGTAFQERVWRALRAIAFGEWISYGQMAKNVGNPAAVRAIGRASGQNPVCIIQPCHRVLGANRDLVGFGGGLPMKKWLLAHEGIPVGTVRGRPMVLEGGASLF